MVAKTKKVTDKEKRDQTLKKWKEDNNEGQREKILKMVLQDGSYSKHI